MYLKEQLNNEFHYLIEQNRQQYEISNDKYNQLEIQLSELKSFILHMRDNAVHLSSEINTYQCLLANLVPSSQQKTKSSPYIQQTMNFTVHIEHGLLYVRI